MTLACSCSDLENDSPRKSGSDLDFEAVEHQLKAQLLIKIAHLLNLKTQCIMNVAVTTFSVVRIPQVVIQPKAVV